MPARYVRVPLSIIDRLPDLDGSALAVVLALSSHSNAAGAAWPGIDRLGALTGRSRRSVQLALRKLESLGMIRSASHHGRSTTYTLTSCAADCAPTDDGAQQIAPHAQQIAPHAQQIAPHAQQVAHELVLDDDVTSSSEVLARAMDGLWPRVRELDQADAEQLAGYSIVVGRGMMPMTWLTAAIAAAASAKSRPMGYLWRCLAGGLVERGRCAAGEETATMQGLMAEVHTEAVVLAPNATKWFADRRLAREAARAETDPVPARFAPAQGDELAGALDATAAARAAMRAARARRTAEAVADA